MNLSAWSLGSESSGITTLSAVMITRTCSMLNTSELSRTRICGRRENHFVR